MRLHWHRRDLRLADVSGLDAASPDDPVLGLFIVDERIHGYASPARVAFVLDGLKSLRAAYRDRGGQLVVRIGDPETLVREVAEQVEADIISCHWDYSGLARRRDGRVASDLEEMGVAFERHHDGVLVPPGTLTTADGDPYRVFSYYGKKWLDRDHDVPRPRPEPDALAESVDIEPGSIPTRSELGYEEPRPTVPAASPAAASARLDEFVDESIFEYADAREYPAKDGTSCLSVHLRFGTVGVRTVDAAARRAAVRADDEDQAASVEEYRRQLAWRDFYTERLFHEPDMVVRNLTEFEHDIEWENDEADFAAWTAGETGYPIVDAGMRQLRTEGWLHNRVRMIVASFLTKHLRIDWRWGYGWFRETLLDHDPANDAGGWQWAASTGTDAQPFFRIFNPASQAEQYDPNGTYIREYVPELRDVSPATIHDWTTLDADERCELAPDYRSPIVDHAAAREAALSMYRRARGEEPS